MSLRSGRQYASADTSNVGRGLAAAGEGVAGLGLELKRQDAEEKQKQNTVDLARAEASKTEGLLKKQNEFDFDPDYSTYKDRVPKATGDIVKSAANLIRDPELRERWILGAQTDAARVNDGIFDRGTTIRRQAETVAFDDALETNRRIYVDPETTPEAKAKAKKDIEGAIATGQSTGLLTPDAASARRTTFIDNAEFSRRQLEVERDPSVISKPLPRDVSDRTSTAVGFFQSRGWTKEQAAGIVGNLLAESSLNTSARNAGDGRDGSDSVGVGQWNGDRARALKSFAAQNHADWRDFGIQLAFVDHELRTSEKSAGDQIRAAKDVRAAAEGMIMYERPAGSQNGPQNAHNYKGRLKYAAQAAGQDVNPDWFKAFSPENRQRIIEQAETRQNQINVETRGAIDVAVTNAPAAIQNTGRYDGTLPTADQFMSAYGPQDGAQRYNNFQASVQTSEQAFNMRTMSSEQILKMVSDAKPTSTGDGAALETARYKTLASAAETTIKAREADPSTYTQQTFPAVAQAWQEASASGNYQAALAQTAAAQRQLGVQDMRLLPKDIAEGAVTKFKDDKLSERDRLETATSLIFSTPDASQRRAVFNQLVAAGLPDITEGAVEALARGDNGAARRLFQAAMVDPSKLPGQGPFKPADIDQQIQADIMDQGKIGDIYYGLSDGSTQNFVKAQRDQKLLVNAVNLRVRNGEDLEAAIASASKDLYGDVQAVTDSNAQILLPTTDDPRPVLKGLNSLMPTVRGALQKTMQMPSAAPAGDFAGVVEQGNIDLAARPTVKNEDGSISTVRSMSFNEDGNEILVPTVSPEGKILSDEAAIDLYHKTGQHLGKFATPAEADAYANALHTAQEQFYAGGATGRAVVGAATGNYIDSVIADGYFRNSGDGFVFIDPFVGAAVADETGKPIIFTMDDVLAQAAEQPQRTIPTDNAPLSDDMFDAFQKRMQAK